ncbi:hypothetical protein GOP47_0006220 [Adiantum capillus-veneris]|uniref:Bifunctional inhibitor/plant lipid transfer protein/seed storage helical domain-containing protein n=1 Tax=Adiantum capillus-veneris TaxID=13818 RepID=A0A9D4ZK70_ADICA|nr:hypothetical protein GOP47_0006220 [Adiantum capillus-veneris]
MGSSKATYGVLGLCAIIMAMLMIADGVAGQAPATAPTSGAVDCDAEVLKLVDCLGFVSGMENTPPAACCGNLSSVVGTTPQCLCQLYNTTFTEPLGVNITRAMMLPPACNVTTPDPSLCSVVGIPVPSGPSGAPMSPAAPAMAPSSVPTPSVSTPSAAPTTPTGLPPMGAATPSTEMSPSNDTSSPPGNNGADLSGARGLAAALSLLFALGILFH